MVYVSFTTQQNIESQMWKAKDLECSQGVTDGRTDGRHSTFIELLGRS